MSDAEPLGGWARGLSWNYLALASSAVAGLLTSVVVAGGFGPAGLGVFTQTLTFFVLAAQVAVLGIHYSVLHRTARSSLVAEQRALVNVAFSTAIPLSVAVAGVSFLIAPVIGVLVQSSALVPSLRLASVALVFHALTKVVSAGLNGARRMGHFAAVNATRFLAMLVSAVVITLADLPVETLGLVLVSSEVAALTAAILAWGGVRLSLDISEASSLVRYGIRAAPAAVTVEVNSRVDIISLGIFTSDAMVGVYGLAATLYEGLLQVFVVLRNQVNPHVATSVTDERWSDVESLQRRLWPWAASLTLIALLATFVFWEPVVSFAGLDQSFTAARGPLLILLVGVALAASVLPFDQALVVSGQPSAQSEIGRAHV